MLKELIKENAELITTEKDYCRIKEMGYDNIKFEKISLKINRKQQFINLILNKND